MKGTLYPGTKKNKSPKKAKGGPKVSGAVKGMAKTNKVGAV